MVCAGLLVLWGCRGLLRGSAVLVHAAVLALGGGTRGQGHRQVGGKEGDFGSPYFFKKKHFSEKPPKCNNLMALGKKLLIYLLSHALPLSLTTFFFDLQQRILTNTRHTYRRRIF